jgi:hypothetical protein
MFAAQRILSTLKESPMPFRQAIVAVILVTFAFSATGRVGASHRIKSVKARVKFLATSWLLRGTWGLNEDKYLVELSPSPKEPPFLAYLIDSYPSTFPPQSSEVLTSEVGTTLRLRRDATCDIAFGQIALRTAPGDLMATQFIRLTYQPKLETTPHADETMPCYRTVRE